MIFKISAVSIPLFQLKGGNLGLKYDTILADSVSFYSGGKGRSTLTCTSWSTVACPTAALVRSNARPSIKTLWITHSWKSSRKHGRHFSPLKFSTKQIFEGARYRFVMAGCDNLYSREFQIHVFQCNWLSVKIILITIYRRIPPLVLIGCISVLTLWLCQ